MAASGPQPDYNLRVPRHIKAPQNLMFKLSSVNVGFKGVYCKDTTIEKGTMFGPYVGKIRSKRRATRTDFRFAWEVYNLETMKVEYLVDSSNPKFANWMRYVCCARFFEEQNIVSTQQGTDIYYKAMKDILPGEELLTWFQAGSGKHKPRMVNLTFAEIDEDSTDKNSTSESANVKSQRNSKPQSKTHQATAGGKASHSKKEGTAIPKSAHKRRPKTQKSSADEVVSVTDSPRKQTPVLKATSAETPEKSKSPCKNSPQKVKSPEKMKRIRKPKVFPDAYEEDPAEKNEKKLKRLRDIDQFEPLQPGQKRRRRKKAPVDVSGNTSPCSSPSKSLVKVGAGGESGSTSSSPTGGTKSLTAAVSEINKQVDWQYPAQGEEYVFEIQQQHLCSQAGRKVFKCDICHGLYKHMFSLKRHYLRYHINFRYLSKSDMTNCLINLNQVLEAERSSAALSGTGNSTETAPAVTDHTRPPNTGEVFANGVVKTTDGQVRSENGSEKENKVADLNTVVGQEEKTVLDGGKELSLEDTTEPVLDGEAELSSPKLVIDVEKKTEVHDKKKFDDEPKSADEGKESDSDVAVDGRGDSGGAEGNMMGHEESTDELSGSMSITPTTSDQTSLTASENSDTSTQASRPVSSRSVTRTGLYRCYVCSSLFDTVEEISQHTKDHPQSPGVLPFACDLCNMRFSYKQNLVRHKAVHDVTVKATTTKVKATVKKPLGKSQTGEHGKRTLTLGTDNKKQFECARCQMKFGNLQNLLKHQMVHKAETETQSFPCRFCGKDFPSMANMKKHVRFHLGYRISCRYCPEIYSNVGSLRKHIRVTHPEIYRAKQMDKIARDGVLRRPDKKTMDEEVKTKRRISSSQDEKAEKGLTEIKTEIVEQDEGVGSGQGIGFEHDISFAPDEIDDGGSRFKFSCTVCKKRFSNYINMCRHRRKAHSNESRQKTEDNSTTTLAPVKIRNPPSPVQETPEMVALFYANVSNNIATNMSCYIDGTSDSLEKYEDHIKIEDYTPTIACADIPESESLDLRWENYNFPPDFRPAKTISFSEIRQEFDIHSAFDMQNSADSHSSTTTVEQNTLNVAKVLDSKAVAETRGSICVETGVKRNPDGGRGSIDKEDEQTKAQTLLDTAREVLMDLQEIEAESDYDEEDTSVKEEHLVSDIEAEQNEDEVQRDCGSLLDGGPGVAESHEEDRPGYAGSQDQKAASSPEQLSVESSLQESSTEGKIGTELAGKIEMENKTEVNQSEMENATATKQPSDDNTESQLPVEIKEEPDEGVTVPAFPASSESSDKMNLESSEKNSLGSSDKNNLGSSDKMTLESSEKNNLGSSENMKLALSDKVNLESSDICMVESSEDVGREMASSQPAMEHRADRVSVQSELSSGECSSQDSCLFSTLSLSSSQRDPDRLGSANEGLREIKPDYSEVPVESPVYNYDKIAFGLHGNVASVCAICRKHFRDFECLLRHHWKKHPHSMCNFIEVEQGHEIDTLYFSEPSNVGVLAVTGCGLDGTSELETFSCTRCGSTFKNVSRLHVHIVTCAPTEVTTGEAKAEKKVRRKYKQRVKEALSAGQSLKSVNDVSGYNSQLTENQVENPRKRIFMGCRKRKAIILPDTPVKLSQRQKQDIGYNPQNHIRRRELTELLDTHQCEACGVKFKSISLLERHVKKCKNKEKFKDLRPMKCLIMEESLAKLKHECFYCGKNFTYMKSLLNHFQDFCPIKKLNIEKGELSVKDQKREAELIESLKLQEEEKNRQPEEVKSCDQFGKRKAGWPKGLKRKSRRKGHAWTYIKRKKSTGNSEGSELQGDLEEDSGSSKADDDDDLDEAELGPDEGGSVDVETPEEERQCSSELRKYLEGNIDESSEKLSLPSPTQSDSQSSPIESCLQKTDAPASQLSRDTQKAETHGTLEEEGSRNSTTEMEKSSAAEADERKESLLKVALLEKSPEVVPKTPKAESVDSPSKSASNKKKSQKKEAVAEVSVQPPLPENCEVVVVVPSKPVVNTLPRLPRDSSRLGRWKRKGKAAAEGKDDQALSEGATSAVSTTEEEVATVVTEGGGRQQKNSSTDESPPTSTLSPVKRGEKRKMEGEDVEDSVFKKALRQPTTGGEQIESDGTSRDSSVEKKASAIDKGKPRLPEDIGPKKTGSKVPSDAARKTKSNKNGGEHVEQMADAYAKTPTVEASPTRQSKKSLTEEVSDDKKQSSEDKSDETIPVKEETKLIKTQKCIRKNSPIKSGTPGKNSGTKPTPSLLSTGTSKQTADKDVHRSSPKKSRSPEKSKQPINTKLTSKTTTDDGSQDDKEKITPSLSVDTITSQRSKKIEAAQANSRSKDKPTAEEKGSPRSKVKKGRGGGSMTRQRSVSDSDLSKKKIKVVDHDYSKAKKSPVKKSPLKTGEAKAGDRGTKASKNDSNANQKDVQKSSMKNIDSKKGSKPVQNSSVESSNHENGSKVIKSEKKSQVKTDSEKVSKGSPKSVRKSPLKTGGGEKGSKTKGSPVIKDVEKRPKLNPKLALKIAEKQALGKGTRSGSGLKDGNAEKVTGAGLKKDEFDQTHKLLAALESPEPVDDAFFFPKVGKEGREGVKASTQTKRGLEMQVDVQQVRRVLKLDTEKPVTKEESSASDISR